MRSKEEYLELVLANRALLASPDDAACPCPKRKCECMATVMRASVCTGMPATTC